ncbi:PAS domain-containing protein [Microvirga sp. BT688]|uniref:PAS domain-containing sensor histidine kinase n=1 Tax=Microvirga sp. TaxID=1873136 RepID=UPI0016839AD8|nr:PAS domain-containing protein [Microvirga sp.]MBD2746652.1 PAS domain-containing protein [Microvirga sp.]
MDDAKSIRLLGRNLSRSPGVRGWVIFTVAVTVVLSFLIAAGVLLWHAVHERHTLEHRGLSAAVATVNVLDREAEALGNTLRGLSRSPLVEQEDLGPFYRQLVATPRPSGARFVLWTPQRQLLNTGVPYGGTLPAIGNLPIRRERLDLLGQRGLVMSERYPAALDGQEVIAISLRLDASGSYPERILTLTVPEDHLIEAVRDARSPEGWTMVILDSKLQVLSRRDQDPGTASPSLTRDMVDRLSSPARNGHFETEGPSSGIWVAFHRSEISGYTAVSVAPSTLVNAPVTHAAYRIALAGAVLLLVGGASASLLIRTGGPVDRLRRDAAMTRSELATANARMSDILESISDCYFTLDRDYRITDVNAAALRWWKLKEGSIVGRSYFDIVGRDPAIDAALAQAIGGRREFRGVLASIYHPGRYIDYRVYPSPEGATIFFSDVTERHEAHRAALREREFLQASLDALSAHVAVLDERGVIISVNEAWHRFAHDNGYSSPSHGIGTNYLDVCGAARHAGMVEERIFRGMEALVAGQRTDFQALYPCPSHDRLRWFQLRAALFMAGSDARIVVAHEDITDIIAARAEVGELSERLLVLQDEERRRIAAELHDSTAQHLVAAGLSLMQVEALGLPPAGKRIIDELDRSLEEALKELRVFTYLLHPPGLDTDGVAGTIRAFVDGFSDRTGLHVSVQIDVGVETLPPELQRALFRIVQEGLANVHRHAGASRAVISLRLTPGDVILCIGDNGHGMRPRRSEPMGTKAALGVGIPGMRIRLSQFGGTLRIRSNRRGTVVRAAVPREWRGMALESGLMRVS